MEAHAHLIEDRPLLRPEALGVPLDPRRQLREVRNYARYRAIAAIICAGAKCEANAYGNPNAAATCAPNRLEPRIHSGTLSPVPGSAPRARCAGRNRLPAYALT